MVCAFINDDLGAPVLERLAAGGTRLIALRSAGYNHVDLAVAKRLGLAIVRVPAYSPHAVAEHAVALAEHHDVVCAFINDDLSAPVLERLAAGGTRPVSYTHLTLPTNREV